jgi:outer membrane protein TolC
MTKMNRKKWRWLCAMLVALVCGLPLQEAKAQGDTLVFSLREAMDYAMDNAYQVRNAQYDVEAAKKKLWETIAIGLPQVSGSAGYNYAIESAKSPFPLMLIPPSYLPPDIDPDKISPDDKIFLSFAMPFDANYNVSVSQLIFDGSYLVGLKATKLFYKLTQEQKEKVDIDVRYMVAQAYYLALTAKENIQTFKRSVEVNEKTLADTKAYHTNGFREEIDVAQIELMVSSGNSRLLEVERSYDVAMAVLKFSIGIDIEQDIVLSDNLDVVLASVLGGDTMNESMDLDKHIDFRLASSNEESKRLLLQNEKVQYFPKVSASYSYNKLSYGDSWNVFGEDWHRAQFLGLNLTVPIFTSGMQDAKVKQEKLNYLKAQTDKIMVSENLKKEHITANKNLTTSKEQYANSLKNKNLAQRIYDVTLVKYNNGLVRSTELSQNEGQYVDAEVNYISSVLNLLQNYLEYQKIIGNL